MANITWNDAAFKKKVVSGGMDGLEEWGKAVWHPQAYRDAPKKTSTMAGSLGVERDDANKCIYVGGGGQAKSYILKQELDSSLRHEVGKSHFIGDAVQQNISKLPEYVKKHVG
jgi:hypothetical protein